MATLHIGGQLRMGPLGTVLLVIIIAAAYRLYFDDQDASVQNLVSDDALSGLQKYCNFVKDISIGEEVKETAALEHLGFKLDKIIVLVRHGDRGPLRTVKELDKINCDKGTTEDNAESRYHNLVEELIDGRSILKHLKYRLNLPDDFVEFPGKRCSLARLTKLGLLQHVKLGYLISSAYSSRLGLTASNWHSSLKVTTTRYSRTFQSALALVHGISRHLNGSSFSDSSDNIPEIHLAYGTFFCGYNESSPFCLPKCAAIDRLRFKLNSEHLQVDNQAKQSRINSELVHRMAKVIAANSSDLSSFKSLVSILDGLSAYVCHRQMIPCDSNYGCVNSSQVKDLLANICLQVKFLQHSPSYQHSSWLKLYGFLIDLINQIRYSEKKVLLYSGHDISIEPLKAIFRLADCSIPPYASRLIFEIHSRNSQQYLRVIYNGDDVTEFLPILNKFRSEPTITLVEVSTFEQFIHDQFFLYTGTRDYEYACSQGHSAEAAVQVDDDQSRV